MLALWVSLLCMPCSQYCDVCPIAHIIWTLTVLNSSSEPLVTLFFVPVSLVEQECHPVVDYLYYFYLTSHSIEQRTEITDVCWAKLPENMPKRYQSRVFCIQGSTSTYAKAPAIKYNICIIASHQICFVQIKCHSKPNNRRREISTSVYFIEINLPCWIHK